MSLKVGCLKMLHSELRQAWWYPMFNLCFLCHEPLQVYNSCWEICSFRWLIVLFMHEQRWCDAASRRTTSFLNTLLEEISSFPVSGVLNSVHFGSELTTARLFIHVLKHNTNHLQVSATFAAIIQVLYKNADEI